MNVRFTPKSGHCRRAVSASIHGVSFLVSTLAAAWSNSPQSVHAAFMSPRSPLLQGTGQHGVESWLERKRAKRRNKRPHNLQACASYWGGALAIFRFRGVTDLAKRLNSVRPLLLWNDLLLSQSVTPLAPRYERRRSRACAMSQAMISALCAIEPSRPERPS
jgi:hypothetical protein